MVLPVKVTSNKSSRTHQEEHNNMQKRFHFKQQTDTQRILFLTKPSEDAQLESIQRGYCQLLQNIYFLLKIVENVSMSGVGQMSYADVVKGK